MEKVATETVESSAPGKEKKTKMIRIKASPREIIEVKMRAREAGFSQVAPFFWHLLKQREAVDKWRYEAALEAAKILDRFHISPEMLAAAQSDVGGRVFSHAWKSGGGGK